ncbi:MAG: hypothetical protein NC253_01895 [Ruminococcus sp.]|nr:hypothetical protein [Ruminococcus sp.]MCM1380544.1 hypothetical protein [Muribaculaceae bacterium]MCM1479137.1 hypothetical protein [Muribaculaceae bacterium]
MIRKLRKIFPAVISAVLCVTMALGIAVSADVFDDKAAADKKIWSETKAIANAKYYPTYIKWAEKYSAKETKNTVSYSKSRTKKFFDKVNNALKADEPQFSLAIIDKESVSCVACKGDKAKNAGCNYGVAMAIYADGNDLTVLSINKKLKTADRYEGDTDYGIETYADIAAFYAAWDIKLNVYFEEEGKIFKFKSGDKIYFYEEFKSGNLAKVGFLFNEKGTPLAMTVDGSASCVSFKTKVDDSEFDIPKGYKTVNTDEFYGFE